MHLNFAKHILGFCGGTVVKNLPASAGGVGSIPLLGRSLEEEITDFSVLAWEIHGQRSLASYSPWDCKELDMTE